MDADRLDISSDRLWNSLEQMAKVGATVKGGVKRLAFTAEDRAGRRLFLDWCEQAGLSVATDAIGNLFARRAGRDPGRGAIVAGSHLDSQPTGGRYDGTYGVLAALEVVRTLNDAAIETAAPIEIACWANEEGTRFQPALMGSSVFTGRLPLADMLAARDESGISVQEELAADPTRGELRQRDGLPVAAYLEVHIEQGPVLEKADLPLGIVAGVQAIRWYDIAIVGQEAHAGPTPMELRHDALMAAAELTLAFERVARDHGPDGRGTVGTLRLSPGSRNVIPGAVWLTGDLRHPDDRVIEDMESRLRADAVAIAARRGLDIDIKRFWQADAVPFDPALKDLLRRKARDRGIPFTDIVSGAGHDAQCLARIAPTAMVFVPCLDGISHNEAESITQDQAATGCRILFDAVSDVAGRA